MFRVGLGLVAGQISEGLPDEAGEFTGHGDERFVAMNAACEEVHEAPMKAILSGPTGFKNAGGLALLAAGEGFADLGRTSIVLTAFDEKPASMGIAAFGDGSLAAFVATGVLAGDEAEVGHELAGMLEAEQGTQLRDGDHGGHDLKAFEGHEGFDGGLESPGFQQIGHGVFATGDAGSSIVDGHEALMTYGHPPVHTACALSPLRSGSSRMVFMAG